MSSGGPLQLQVSSGAPPRQPDRRFPVVWRGYDRDAVDAQIAALRRERSRAMRDATATAERLVEVEAVARRLNHALDQARALQRGDPAAIAEVVVSQADAERRAAELDRENSELLTLAREMQAELVSLRGRSGVAHPETVSLPPSRRADVCAELGDQAAAVLREAALAADSVRSTADEYAARVRAEAEQFSTQLLREAEEARAAADRFTEEARRNSEARAERVLAAAEEQAKQVLDMADSHAADLSAMKQQFLQTLDAMKGWVQDSIASETPAFDGEDAPVAPADAAPEAPSHGLQWMPNW